MKIKYLLLTLTLGFMLSSCAVSYPMLITEATSGSKTGSASYKVFLGIPPMKADIGIQKIADKAGITKVSTVDFTVKSSIIFMTYTTTVTGE